MSSTTFSSKTVRRTVTSGSDVHESVDSSNYQVYRGMSPASQSRLENRVKELEEGLEHERSAHSRTHKLLSDIQIHVQGLQDKLEEAEREISVQINIIRVRDGELLQVKKDAEMSLVQHESNDASLKKRFQDQINELTEQLEKSFKAKSKVEKEKQLLALEVDSFPERFDEINKAKNYAEQKYENLDEQVRRLRQQNDELTHSNNELTQARQRITQENADLQSYVKELETKYKASVQDKIQLQQKYDSTQTKLDEQIRIYVHIEVELSKAREDFEHLLNETHDHTDKISKLQDDLQKALADGQVAKSHYEKDIAAVKQEYEDTRRKLNSRLLEVESQLEQYRAKATRLEKDKHKLTINIEDLTASYESANAAVNEQVKLVKHAETSYQLLERRIGELQNELQGAHNDNKRLQAELAQAKQAVNDQQVKNETQARDNRSLADSLHVIELKLKELTRDEQELQAVRNQLISERDTLQIQVHESSEYAHDLQTKLDTANNQINQLRIEIDNVIYVKNDELENERRGNKRTIDELTHNLSELENRLKTESNRWKNKLDSERQELVIQIELVNKTNADLSKSNKALAARIKDVETLLEAERVTVDQLSQAVSAAERKLTTQHAELEELRIQLTSSQNARKILDTERSEVNIRINEINITVQTLTNEKRRVESELEESRRRYDGANTARLAAEERVDKLAADLKKAQDQLRQEQSNIANLESRNKQLEAKLREQLVVIEQFEATKDSKRTLAKLQSQVNDLQSELDTEQRRGREYVSEIKKFERLWAESKLQYEAEHHIVVTQIESIHSFDDKLAALKRQLKSTEEMLTITVGKYRKTQQLLEEAERRADKNLNLVTSSTVVSIGSGGTTTSRNSVRRRSYSVNRETSSSSKYISY